MILLLAAAALHGCGSSAPAVPASISKAREVHDNLAVGGSDSVLVKVTDASGTPSSGVTVTFAVLGGGGISAGSAITGADGVAGVLWTLGRVAGAQSVTATSGALGTVTFTANARVGPAATITKLGADPVNQPAGVSIDIFVLVADQFGNPRVGDQVTFAVTAGGGSVSPTTITTSSSGTAQARWTLGATVLALNSVTATVAGLPAVTWSTTTTNAAAVVVLKSPRIIVVDSGATAAVDFEARDGAGNVLTGQPLVAVSRNAAAVYANGIVTGARRGQTFIVVASALNAAAVDSVLVIVGVPNAPILVTDLTSTDFGLAQTIVVTIILDLRTSGARLGALTTLVTWNPQLLSYVSDADGSPAVGATVNAGGASGGSLALTMASAGGLTGRVQLRQITFKTGTASRTAGSLLMLPTELRSTTFADLLLSTVTASYPMTIR